MWHWSGGVGQFTLSLCDELQKDFEKRRVVRQGYPDEVLERGDGLHALEGGEAARQRLRELGLEEPPDLANCSITPREHFQAFRLNRST